ncbi:glycosyltransferase [Nostoc sp. 'Peltigera membranacea cyanobiont' N6]|uniref:glycosyltransferase n=1 Tax=Nostoc sp. 'Peltigera membranacea cyanobiont' N6 TaxID=1261031 RepID=UPI000CF338F1|nr:glycosyltransferase [Nostoc sp. 'Peltigera membranacea cyanobiont' N6]AVH62364.1 group 1 glycosyltransferase [Nostoc sp. 'Peltigera membranacea cyanobiont' N6]
MIKIANDALRLLIEKESHLLEQNFEVFRSLVGQTRDFLQRRDYNTAAVYAQIAALYANGKHCGLFSSPELEHILLTIGQKAIRNKRDINKSTSSPATPKKVLHVATSVMSIGGHSRMLWRWIQQDTERSHSLVLTQQGLNKVPQILRDAVNNSHGKIYILNERIGSVLSWAKQLREIAATADLVVLHIHNYDVIPIIAFANKEQSPPIIFLDHADHLFWLGTGVSDVVVNLRMSGMNLAQKRRGIASERNVLLPIILEPTHRMLSHTAAKQQLGLNESSIVLLSIARAVKYKTIDGITYIDAHIPLLKQYENAILIVVGPGNREDWSDAIQRTQGRIKVYEEREDTAVFYQAADIYVDSFPFVSNTSLLEAGSYGLPLVTRHPYSDASEILGADMPGLTGNLIRVADIDEYTTVLSHLVEDKEFRLSLGEETRKKIAVTHWGDNWQRQLNDVYVHAMTLPSLTVNSVPKDQIFLGEPDVFLPHIYGWNIDFDWLIQFNLQLMPLNQRLRHWLKFVKKHGVRNRLSLLLPEWFKLNYYSRFRSLFPF